MSILPQMTFILIKMEGIYECRLFETSLLRFVRALVAVYYIGLWIYFLYEIKAAYFMYLSNWAMTIATMYYVAVVL